MKKIKIKITKNFIITDNKNYDVLSENPATQIIGNSKPEIINLNNKK